MQMKVAEFSGLAVLLKFEMASEGTIIIFFWLSYLDL